MRGKLGHCDATSSLLSSPVYFCHNLILLKLNGRVMRWPGGFCVEHH
jgi:hypothetical protein